MEIIYIANARIPTEKAHGLQIMKMGESFSSAGAAVELILPTRVNSPEFKGVDPFLHYKIKKVFGVKRVKCFDPVFLAESSAGTYIKFQAFFFFLSLFFYLLFKKNKKDCIFYTRDEYLLPLIHLFSKKVVWECHALPQNKDFYAKNINALSHLIVLTGKMKEELVKSGVDEKKILISPDAVDLDIFNIKLDRDEARKELGLPTDKTILGYTGSFKTKGMDKGIAVILEALKIVLQDRKDVIFIAVGGSAEDIEYYQSLAKNIGVSELVMLLGAVDQRRLAVYQKAFDLLLMPFPQKKHYAYFMSPLKMFEYMAAKRPIIASNLPSIREILDDDSALFVEPDSSISLAEGIDFCLKDGNFCDKISGGAFVRVQNYTWSKRAEEIINFIK